MITDRLVADYAETPAELAFELRYSDLLGEVQRSAQACLEAEKGDLTWQEHALRLYIMTQAMPSVLLNYKICIDFGLPLHPTQYIDFARAEKKPDAYRPERREAAYELFVESIDIAQSVYRLDPICPQRVSGLKRRIPEFLFDFLYTNTPDKYTWRASDPESVALLAERIRAAGIAPAVVIGAAHGSIRPALLLSTLLGCEAFFVRFSMFKRSDGEPILSPADEAHLGRFAKKTVLLFDEDVAKGKTLRGFAERMGGMFREVHTAAVLRHYLAPYTPDFVGETHYD